MKKSTLALFIASTLLLTACGGSGTPLDVSNGSAYDKRLPDSKKDSSADEKKATDTQNEQLAAKEKELEEVKTQLEAAQAELEKAKTANDAETATKTQTQLDELTKKIEELNKSIAGAQEYSTVKLTVLKIDNSIFEKDNTANPNSLTIDDKTYNLSDSNSSKVTSSSYVTYGLSSTAATPTDVIALAQGHQTPASQVPTTGTVTYTGKAYHWNTTDTALPTNPKTASFDVDFANKTISGTITDAATTLASLSGKIDGNAFASENTATIKMKGHFYGPKAEELAGVYQGTATGGSTNFKGSFGAKKQ